VTPIYEHAGSDRSQQAKFNLATPDLLSSDNDLNSPDGTEGFSAVYRNTGNRSTATGEEGGDRNIALKHSGAGVVHQNEKSEIKTIPNHIFGPKLEVEMGEIKGQIASKDVKPVFADDTRAEGASVDTRQLLGGNNDRPPIPDHRSSSGYFDDNQNMAVRLSRQLSSTRAQPPPERRSSASSTGITESKRETSPISRFAGIFKNFPKF